MSVVFSLQAQRDFSHIKTYLEQFNPRRAETFVGELVAACEAIVDMPLAWPLVPRYEATGFRRRPYKSYLIFYELIAPDDTVAILHVLHAARDYERLLFPSD
jgi:toxin ParE1/3/4